MSLTVIQAHKKIKIVHPSMLIKIKNRIQGIPIEERLIPIMIMICEYIGDYQE